MHEKIFDKVWTPTRNDIIEEKRFIYDQIEQIGVEALSEVIGMATTYRENAYAPYSHYKVGAAILSENGDIYGGANSEGVNYSTTNHAEGVAIAVANSEGEGNRNRKFIKAVVVCHEGDSGPCGECLQRIVEHADNCLIITTNPKEEIVRVTTLKAILPYNFNPSHLEH